MVAQVFVPTTEAVIIKVAEVLTAIDPEDPVEATDLLHDGRGYYKPKSAVKGSRRYVEFPGATWAGWIGDSGTIEVEEIEEADSCEIFG